MRTMEESIEQKAQERADRKLQYIIGRYRGCERRTPQTILQRAADPGSKGSVELGSFSLALWNCAKKMPR